MRSHKKKIIAPVTVTVLMIVYYIVYFSFLITLVNGIWKYLLGIVPLAFSLLMIKVCIERIQEIKGGEEDDLGQY